MSKSSEFVEQRLEVFTLMALVDVLRLEAKAKYPAEPIEDAEGSVDEEADIAYLAACRTIDEQVGLWTAKAKLLAAEKSLAAMVPDVLSERRLSLGADTQAVLAMLASVADGTARYQTHRKVLDLLLRWSMNGRDLGI